MFKIPALQAASSVCCLLFTTSSLVLAQAAAPAKPAVGTAVSPAQTYDKVLSIMEQQFRLGRRGHAGRQIQLCAPASLGEFKGVRTFAQQIKHVAESNYYFFGGSDYTDAQAKAMTDSIEKLTTKADIVKALKDSFVRAHAYVGAITPENAFVADGARYARRHVGLWNRARHGPLRPVGGVSAHERDRPPASRGAM